MKILHFAETLKGGPATHLNELVPLQIQRGHQVIILCADRDKQYIAECGADVVVYEAVKRTPAGIYKLYRSLQKEIQRSDVDIVHLHSSFAGLAGRLGSKNGKKIVYCARGWAFTRRLPSIINRAYAFVEKILSKKTDWIINISKDEQEAAERYGLPATKMSVIYNGISDATWTPIVEDGPYRNMLYIGRYDKQKGLDVLLKTFAHLRTSGFTLRCIGSQVLSDQSGVSIPETATDLGWMSRDEIRIELANCDFVVMPSRWEGFGFVAAEALRAGRPVVASHVGGLKEIITHMDTGYLCNPDDENSLTDGIMALAGENLKDMSVRCRERYEALFTSRRMEDEIDMIYRSL